MRMIGDTIAVVTRDVEHMSEEQLVSVREQSRIEEKMDRYQEVVAEIKKRSRQRRRAKAAERLRARQSA